jgi:hypothetical protein
MIDIKKVTSMWPVGRHSIFMMTVQRSLVANTDGGAIDIGVA